MIFRIGPVRVEAHGLGIAVLAALIAAAAALIAAVALALSVLP